MVGSYYEGNEKSMTCVRSLGETQGISTNWIPRNQVLHDIQHQAW